MWWSGAPGTRKKAEEEFRKLPGEMQGRLLKTMQRYFAGETRRGDVDKLDANIWEWRQHKGNNHFRVLFFLWGRYCVAVTAFYKNKQKTPPEDLKRANDRRKTWINGRGVKPAQGWHDS